MDFLKHLKLLLIRISNLIQTRHCIGFILQELNKYILNLNIPHRYLLSFRDQRVISQVFLTMRHLTPFLLLIKHNTLIHVVNQFIENMVSLSVAVHLFLVLGLEPDFRHLEQELEVFL